MLPGVQFLEDIEPRFARYVNVEDDASWALGPGGRQETVAVGEADNLVAHLRKKHRKKIPNRGIVIDNEDLTRGVSPLSHLHYPNSAYVAADPYFY